MTRQDISFSITLNARRHQVSIDPRSLLIEVLRDLGAKGARVGCLTGDCGACTVELDGQLVKSCLVLAASANECDVTSIEGSTCEIATHLQDAFISKKGFQCGYCTPGMILTAADLLRKNPAPSLPEIRHAISGNLCRCTGYEAIVDAIAAAAGSLLLK